MLAGDYFLWGLAKYRFFAVGKGCLTGNLFYYLRVVESSKLRGVVFHTLFFYYRTASDNCQ